MNKQLKVHWFNERPDEKDDNNGYHYGIYIFDCDEADYDEECGYGAYDIIDVEWFKTEYDRDLKFILNLYDAKDEFTPDELEEINADIKSKKVLVKDIKLNFMEWVYSRAFPIDDADIVKYGKHYSKDLTHSQNLENLIMLL